MKKSRIIIPALAMIAFSVAASITGTVAWFTANRTANIDSGTYAVVKTTSNLVCEVKDGLGTSATDNDPGVTDVVAVDGKLTDGSFDHAGSNNYIFAPDGTGTKVGNRYALASATEGNLTRGETTDGDTIFTAVTWEIEFSLEFGSAVSNDVGLYLDLAHSSFTPSGSAAASGQQDTSKGFRMAFIPKGTNSANGNKRVFADLQTAANCTYVGGEPTQGTALEGTETAYVSPVLIDSSSNTALNDAGYTATASASMTNYFGKFAFAADTTVNLEFIVVCWFEGTDANIVNGSEGHETIFRDVEVSLAFSALTFANA